MHASIRYLLAAVVLSASTISTAQTPTPAPPEPGAPVAEVTEMAAPVVEPAPVVAPYVVAAPAGPVCCPIEVLDYRTTHSAKRAYLCAGPAINTTVCVKNPADCCLYSVDFCVPGCCLGEPQVCNLHVGLLGRGYADVVWSNGFTARVVFRVHGGAIVIYSA